MKLVATALAVALLAALGAGSASGAGSAGVELAAVALPLTAPQAVAPALEDPTKDDPAPKRDGPLEKLRAVLDRLVTAGTITTAQAQAITAAAKDALAAKPKKPEAKARQARAGGIHSIGQVQKVVREFLGVTQQDIAKNAQGGKSLADLALTKGKTRDGLIAAILATVDKPTAETTAAVAKLVDEKGRPNAGKNDKNDKGGQGNKGQTNGRAGG